MSISLLLKRILDTAMLTRPVVLIPVWGFCALGFWRASTPRLSSIIEIWRATDPLVYVKITLFSFSVGAVYILNQIADREVDKLNGGLPLLAQGIVSLKSSVYATIICTLIAMFPPLLFHWSFLFEAAVATILLGLFYSFRPFQFSGRPFADFITNAIGYGVVAFGVGWTIGGNPLYSRIFMENALTYVLIMAAGSISSTLPDYDGDRQEGKNTTAVVFGRYKAHLLALFFLVVAGIWSVVMHDTIGLFSVGAALPFYVGYLFRQTSFFMEATYKIGGGLCMLFALITLPLFIVLSVAVFSISLLYYRFRHHTSYPSLTPINAQK